MPARNWGGSAPLARRAPAGRALLDGASYLKRNPMLAAMMCAV
jgi:hypothetical protein